LLGRGGRHQADRQGEDDEQPAMKPARGTETGEAPADPGARRKEIGHLRPTSNAERRDGSPVECRRGFFAGCKEESSVHHRCCYRASRRTPGAKVRGAPKWVPLNGLPKLYADGGDGSSRL
jgi:hypothetical protein